MDQSKVEKALIGLDMLHSTLWEEAAEAPTLERKARLLLVESIMNDLGYGIKTKYDLMMDEEWNR